jgi:hypothetical protein
LGAKIEVLGEEPRTKNQESRIKNQESRIKNQESRYFLSPEGQGNIFLPEIKLISAKKKFPPLWGQGGGKPKTHTACSLQLVARSL